MVVNYGPHKKAQSHSAGDGESYARSISTRSNQKCGDRRRTRVTDIAQPRTVKRSVGRPPTRWTDDIKRVAGSRWIQEAQNSGI
ncbi:jg3370 [Pararge aegeria aegeria]|uniref:Jg3370 protein n=1 Tax=Pararge aegeria aegeria TaxID=348720 RepID=A0A8S4RSI5_9NEOP|nr:jg3370 [Pararge aegeria aegeria]